jgi:CheY-like chemotaxis protein
MSSSLVIAILESELPIETLMPQEGFETILVIDDNSVVLRITEAMLSRHGYRTISCQSGQQAIEFLQNDASAEIHLALVDIVMKDMNGTEAASEIHRLRPDLPVIFMTGFPEHAEFFAAQGQTVLRKPFTSLTLIRFIQGVLNRNRGETSSMTAGEG